MARAGCEITQGTLFLSDSNGTFFVESLKDTNRDIASYMNVEISYEFWGVGFENIVANVQDVDGRNADK